MKKLRLIFIVLIISACSNGSSETSNRPPEWLGEWKAEWETDPSGYPEVTDMEFYMDGLFQFTQDSITVVTNGYPGCIFAIDTLRHTQSWKVSGDSLILFSDPQIMGMTYNVKSFSEDRIQLLILDDISVTLTR